MARDSKNIVRVRIHERIRHKVRGSEERPRLAVYRSLKHIYAQVIDDRKGHTVAAASSSEKNSAVKGGGNLAGAKEIGQLIAQRAKEKGINKVVFDRSGFFLQPPRNGTADCTPPPRRQSL